MILDFAILGSCLGIIAGLVYVALRLVDERKARRRLELWHDNWHTPSEESTREY